MPVELVNPTLEESQQRGEESRRAAYFYSGGFLGLTLGPLVMSLFADAKRSFLTAKTQALMMQNPRPDPEAIPEEQVSTA